MESDWTNTVVAGLDGSERDADALALATALAPHLAAEQVSVVPVRSPARGLQRAARNLDAVLIVLGACRRSGLGRVFPGGTAERLFAGARCPVAIAPPGYGDGEGGLDTIACGFDGSPESHAALAWAKAVARRTGSRLRLVSVHQSRVSAAPAWQSVPMVAEDDAVKRYVHHRATEAAREARLEGIEAEPRLLTGHAESLLVEETRDVDLMVVGSRGHGPARSVLNGTVSGALARAAGCPVVVFPRGVEVNEPVIDLAAAGAVPR
jgi:nucleotide-binding universal stress UspA family protein